MILLTLLLIPTIIAAGFYLFSKSKITLVEFLAQNVIQIIVLSLLLLFVGFGSSWDTETWNGRVAKKYSEHVSCSHSYSCNCYTTCSSDSKGNQSCQTICQTCYDHSYDIDWVVKTTNDESIEIDRVNRRGDREPPRFTAVKIGEPTSVTHSYENYIKASPDSLFRKQGLVDKYANQIPEYPGKIYDYYHLNRFITVGAINVSDRAEWNNDLKELNADLGAAKKVNIIVLATTNLPEEYFSALEQAWIGSKQNDFVLVMNFDKDNKITWANVMAFTTNKLAEVVVRDNVLKIGTLDRVAIIDALRQGIAKNFVKRKMSDFEYLKNSVTPSKGFWIGSMIFGLLLSVGLGLFFHNNEFNESDEQIKLFKGEKMNAVAKVLLGLVAVLVVLGVVGVSSVIGINNSLVEQENGLTAQYKQNQNNYDNMTKKVLEVAQVPAMATEDLEKLTKAAISGRYGSEGSKAVFQFIQEQNPTVSADLYSKVQTVIEAGRNSFEADQKVLLDKKRIYQNNLNTFPNVFIAKFLGFPKIDLDKIDIVTSNRTEKAFDTKKDESIKLRQ